MKVRTVVFSSSDGKRSLQFSTADEEKFGWVPIEFFSGKDINGLQVHFDEIVDRSESALRGILLEQVIVIE